jgi:hypothetical protein
MLFATYAALRSEYNDALKILMIMSCAAASKPV